MRGVGFEHVDNQRVIPLFRSPNDKLKQMTARSARWVCKIVAGFPYSHQKWRRLPQQNPLFLCFVDAFVYGAQLMRPSGFYYATLYHSELYDVCYRRVYDDPQFPLSNHRRKCVEDCESYTRLPSPIIGPAKMIDMRKGEMSRR